jgi:HEAT repeat protein
MLVRIIEESHALGKDHEVVLDTIAALGRVGSDQAAPALATLIARRAFFGRRKLRALKERGVAALAAIGTPRAAAAIEQAATAGDRMLRRIAAGALSGPSTPTMPGAEAPAARASATRERERAGVGTRER